MSLDASLPSSPAPARNPERIRARQAKKLMIELLSKYPIVEAACSKVKISRSTHYKWMSEDDRYRARVNEAMAISIDTVNDLAENNIITGVKRGEHKSSTFWLKNRHPAYKAKPAITRVEEREPEVDLLEEGLMRLPNYVPSSKYVSAAERSERKRKRHPHEDELDAATRKLLKKYEAPDDDDLDEEQNSTRLES